MDKVQKAFMRAVEAHQAKRYKQSRTICRAVLKDAPNHVGCLYLLGVSEFSLGHPVEAERLMRQSLALNPAFPEIHFGFAQILAAQNKHLEAITACLRTLELKPQHAEARCALGYSYKVLGQLELAAQAFRQAIDAKPDYPEAFNHLGILYCEQGKLAEATAAFEQALALRPAYPEALNNMGVTCNENRNFTRAVEVCKQAIALQPTYAAAYNNLGNARRALGQWDLARDCFQRALELDPDSAEVRNNLGLVLLDIDADPENAASCFRQILAKNPNHVAALTHLGITYCHTGGFAEGLECYDRALALQPDYREALNNRGNALRALGRTGEAIEAYEQVVRTKPDDSEGHNNLAMSLLAAGDFDKGWREYEWRWQTTQLAAAQRDFSQPQWRGEDAKGQVLLIHAEQGFGDTLQFCRYAPLAAARGLRVMLEVQPELVRLMRSVAGVEKVIGRGDSLPNFDLHCPMMSLPLAFTTTLESIPWNGPYLSVQPDAGAIWKDKLRAVPHRKIGLIWAGNPRLFSSDLAAANRRRSISPDALLPLIGTTNTEFYSLQKDGPAVPAALGLIDLMPQCLDFADTAALIANLDLIISVDTAVAHLAAAMGKPVWLLNRYDSCWRWPQDRADSPWYPTLRLFHQSRPGDWDSVIAQIRAELDL